MPFRVAQRTLEKLDWPELLDRLAALTLTPRARARLAPDPETAAALFETEPEGVRARLAETAEARALLRAGEALPLGELSDRVNQGQLDLAAATWKPLEVAVGGEKVPLPWKPIQSAPGSTGKYEDIQVEKPKDSGKDGEKEPDATADDHLDVAAGPEMEAIPASKEIVTGELVHDDLVLSAALCSLFDLQSWGLARSEVIRSIDPILEMAGAY